MDSTIISISQPLQKKPKRRKRIVIIILAALLLVAAAVFGVSRWRSAKEATVDANISYIGLIPVTRDYLPIEAAGRTNIKREIRYVVIHETDNFSAGADAAAHNSFIHQNAVENELSWHYTVDDHQIYHHLPDDEAAYHASDRMEENGGNLNGIGVELCVNEDGDYELTLENAVQLTATLIDEYGLRIKDIKQHQDFSGKICPAKLIEDGRWDEFLERVKTARDEIQYE